MKASELAKTLNVSRRTVYAYFKRYVELTPYLDKQQKGAVIRIDITEPEKVLNLLQKRFKKNLKQGGKLCQSIKNGRMQPVNATQEV